MQIIKVKGINAPGRLTGCEKAPSMILKALDDIWGSEKGKVVDKRLLDLEEIHLDNNNLEEANELIYKNSKKVFSEQDKVVFLGGDHNISYSLVKGFKEQFENPFLIVFDAHVDCIDPGTGKMAQEPSHEEWLRKLILDGFNPKNIVIIGARNIWPEERVFLNEKGIKVIGMKEIQEKREEICDAIMEKAKNSDALYLSVDIDSIDPAYAPGTGYLEPGGLSSRELIYFLQRLAILKNFKGGDIVEINPEIDKKHGNRTIKLGAKILAELI